MYKHLYIHVHPHSRPLYTLSRHPSTPQLQNNQRVMGFEWWPRRMNEVHRDKETHSAHGRYR